MPSVTDVQQQQQQQQQQATSSSSSSSNIHGKSTPPPSSQPVTTTDSTSTDPIIQAIQLLEKKQRNLGKRKEKLEGYQQEAKTGKDLNKDQKEALAKYPEVIGQIECVKELSEQLKKIQTESSKNQKRLLKQAADEKRQLVSQRLREYAKIRHLLDHRPASLKAEESALLDDLSAVIIPKDGSSDSISRSVETIVSIYQGTSSTTTIKNLPGKNAQEVREMLEHLLRSFEPQTTSSSSSSVIVPEQTQEQKIEVNETDEIQPTNPTNTDTDTDNNNINTNTNTNTNRNEIPVQLDTRTQNISYEQAIQNSLFLPDDNENQNPDETHDEPSSDSKQHIESLTIVNSNQQQQQQQRSSSIDEQQHDESVNQTHSNDQQQRDEQWQHHQGHGNAQRGGQFHNGAGNRPYHTGRSANYNPNWRGSYGGRYDNSSYGGGGQRPYYDNQRGRGGSNSNYRGNRGGNYRYGGNRGYNNNGNGYHKSGQYQQNTHQQVHSAPPASTQQQ